MSEIKDGGPAFVASPVPDPNDPNKAQYGMSLRDWFAGQALSGLYACRDLQLATLHDNGILGSGDFNACMAKQAYQQADAMLVAREAKP